MNKNHLVILLLISFLSFECSNSTQNQNDNSEVTKTTNQLLKNSNLKLQIYYFHATHRCATCNSIEENVKQVIENYYKNEMDNGILEFKVLCVDEQSNKDIVKKYEATGAALHLVKIENAKEQDHDLTEFAFMYSRSEPDFFLKGMQDTIRYFLK
jgi:hypothetical protein